MSQESLRQSGCMSMTRDAPSQHWLTVLEAKPSGNSEFRRAILELSERARFPSRCAEQRTPGSGIIVSDGDSSMTCRRRLSSTIQSRTESPGVGFLRTPVTRCCFGCDSHSATYAHESTSRDTEVTSPSDQVEGFAPSDFGSSSTSTALWIARSQSSSG